MKQPEMKGQFDLILMAETFYNVEYYPSLLSAIDFLLKPDSGKVLIATKTFYFGLGGGLFEWQQYVKKEKADFEVETVLKINDLQSIERCIVKMSRGQGQSMETEDEVQDNFLSFD